MKNNLKIIFIFIIICICSSAAAGDGYFVQREQRTGRTWRGKLIEFKKISDNEFECKWKEQNDRSAWLEVKNLKIELSGKPDYRIKITIKGTFEEWTGVYCFIDGGIKAEGKGVKGAYNWHYGVFSLRITHELFLPH